MKKGLKKFKRDIKGSVSLFFIIIVAIVFAFNAVLIDYARILAAKQQTEYAVQTSVRSTLAQFDEELSKKYGLFGVKDENVDAFEEVLKKNLESTGFDDDSFNFLNMTVENSDSDLSRKLVEVDVFKHQILEDAKYKAPIEIIEEIVEKILKTSKSMKEASTFIGIASEISKLFEEREDLLNEVFKLVDETEKEVKALKKEFSDKSDYKDLKIGKYFDIPDKFSAYKELLEDLKISEEEVKELKLIRDGHKLLGKIAGLSENEYNNKIKKIELEIEEIKKKIKETNNEKESEKLEEELEELEKEKETIEKDLEDYKELKEVLDRIDEVNDDIAKWRDLKVNFEKEAEKKAKELKEKVRKMKENMVSLYEKIEKVEKLNNDIQKVINSEEADKDELYGDAISLSNSSEGTGDLNDITTDISEETTKLKDYVYDENIFKDIYALIPEGYEETLEESETQLGEIEKAFKSKDIDEMSKYEEDKFYAPKLKESIEKFVEPLKDINKGPIKKIKKHQKEHFQTGKKSKEEQDEEEKKDREKAKENNDETKEHVEDLGKTGKDFANDAADYAKLHQLLEGIETEIEMSENLMHYDDDAEDSAKNAAGIMDTLFSGLGSAIKGGRDRLYVNEYILSRFESKMPSDTNEDFLLKNREVEYIMYGQEIPGGNYAALLVELSAFRFVFNFISAFKEGEVKAAPHPIAKLIVAAGFAFTFTIEDMDDLVSGKPTYFIRNIIPHITLDYEDYVRLFLFINPSGEKRYKRMMAMIGFHGKDLTEMNTYIAGTVETSVDLLFFPQAANILNKTGFIEGEVDKDKFKIKHEAHFSY